MLSTGSVNRIRINNLNLPALSTKDLATFIVSISGCLPLITNLAAVVQAFFLMTTAPGMSSTVVF